MMTNKGFSLLELMVTIVIAGILLTIAIPSFNTTMINNNIRAQANSLVAALKFARSESIKRGTEVRVCSSSDQSTCNSAVWNQGWLVAVSSPFEVLRIWEDAADRIPEDTGGSAVKYIEFSPDGTTSNLKSNGNNAVFVLVNTGCSGENQRTVSVKQYGRITTTLSDCP